jgi:hypothetical protein
VILIRACSAVSKIPSSCSISVRDSFEGISSSEARVFCEALGSFGNVDATRVRGRRMERWYTSELEDLGSYTSRLSTRKSEITTEAG